MKTYIKNLFLLPALIAGLGLIPAGRVTAQTFTNLHSFAGWPSEGASPLGRLILSGNTLYGTAGGGSNGYGSIFKLNVDGTGFTNLYSFTASYPVTNSDGAAPRAGLILSGNTLYGTASTGGSHGYGTVFAIDTDGTGFTNLHSFTGFDGMNPVASLVLSGNTLYGTTRGDDDYSYGTVFAINTDGTGFTNLHIFGSDGVSPLAGLVLSGNTLYGTTQGGGDRGYGMVFAVNTDGSGFTNVFTFTGANGAFPYAGLILSGNTLYGTTFGDPNIPGTVFKVNTDGTGFTNLHTFNFSDGFYPTAGLILSGNSLYGTAHAGGSLRSGTVFAVNTDSTGFANLYDFTALPDAGGPPYTNSDGAYPWAGLILSGNTLYGTTSQGGSLGAGTVFSLSFPPRLNINRSGANVVLTWPTHFAGFDYTGFTLQSTTNLFPIAWSPVAQVAVTNAGQISVTVPTTDARKFFWLKSQ